MNMKFKIGFTIDGETLFGMLSKMLPIENLSVEEIVPKPTLAERAIAVNRLTQQAIDQKRFPPVRKKADYKRQSPGPSLTKGVNMVIVHELDSGPKKATEIQPKAKAAGFSPNSVNSRLEALRNHGVVGRIGDGRWRLLKETNAT